MAVNLRDVGNAMFRDKHLWSKVSDKDKEDSFFIFNRYFSKDYPFLSSKLNTKSMNKALCMDIWFRFMYDKPYPHNFWSKVDMKKPKPKYSDDIINRLILNYDLDRKDIHYLIEHNEDIFKEEVNYFKQIDKENGRK